MMQAERSPVKGNRTDLAYQIGGPVDMPASKEKVRNPLLSHVAEYSAAEFP